MSNVTANLLAVYRYSPPWFSQFYAVRCPPHLKHAPVCSSLTVDLKTRNCRLLGYSHQNILLELSRTRTVKRGTSSKTTASFPPTYTHSPQNSCFLHSASVPFETADSQAPSDSGPVSAKIPATKFQPPEPPAGMVDDLNDKTRLVAEDYC